MTEFFTTWHTSYYVLLPLFFIVAVVYASVGFGGGSSYLALLSLFSLESDTMRIIALLCNIAVVSGSVVLYYKKDLYRQSKVLTLVAWSVPLAFIGGRIPLSDSRFKMLLGITLIAAAIFMSLPKKELENQRPSSPNRVKNSIIGGVLGFVSGLLGMGGGVFLSPYLHLTRYDRSIRIAAFTSLFILVNSIAGIAGQWSQGIQQMNVPLIFILVLAVFIGGQIGTRIGVKKLSSQQIKKITAFLIGIVGIRTLWTLV